HESTRGASGRVTCNPQVTHIEARSMTLLDDLQSTIAGVADRLRPSVVGLGRGWAAGSGVVIGDGQVATVAHAVRREAPTVTLAVPLAADLVERLARGERVERRRLGIALAPPHVARRMRRAVGLDERDGLLVRGVRDGSPADRAGIRRGDLILSDLDDLNAAI